LNRTNQPTLTIFSGLPGTGKSTLANRLARELRWPVLRIDDVAGDVPVDADFRFWDEKILVLLTIVEEQLKLGVSVIADSVFMGTDRLQAQEMAARHGANFRPVYCFVSDEKEWKKRVTERLEMNRFQVQPIGNRFSTSASGFLPGKGVQVCLLMQSNQSNKTLPRCLIS